MCDSPTLVLVADDDPAIASLLCEILADEGYDTIRCLSGAAALDAVDSEQPDLIIVDLQMERADSGLQVLTHLREDPSLRHVPAILCSAAMPRLNELRPKLGELRCVPLQKPFDVVMLLDVVDRLLRRAA
jgi:CheY-like chemotaxis protein